MLLNTNLLEIQYKPIALHLKTFHFPQIQTLTLLIPYEDTSFILCQKSFRWCQWEYSLCLYDVEYFASLVRRVAVNLLLLYFAHATDECFARGTRALTLLVPRGLVRMQWFCFLVETP